jgi:hypothetical protein
VGYSKIYLGADIAQENEIVRALGKDVASLHVGAQRVAWGLLMGERVGVDLDATVKELLERHDDEPMAHVTVAVARFGQGKKDDAEKHLEHARERMRDDHPWRALVDSTRALTSFVSEPRLVEEDPARVYRVIAVKSAPGIDCANVNVATFLRVKSGALVCINPVKMTDELVRRIRKLGDVTHVIAPAKYHNENVLGALEAFPEAKAWGVPGHEGYDGVKDIPFAGLLRDDEPLFPDEIDQVTMHGLDLGDVWLIDRASRTAIVTDSVLVQARDDRYRTPFGAFYRWAWGLHERDIGIPSYQPPMWKDLSTYQASMRRALEHGFDNVASSHGAWKCSDGDDKALLQRSVEWFLALDRIDGIRLVADFAWRHPKMTYRFVKEQIAVARAKRAST